MSQLEEYWISALSDQLGALSAESREDIVRDYREHFFSAREAGRTDEEIAAKLGDARAIGRGFAAQEKIANVEKSSSVVSRSWGLLGVVKALLILAPLNFIVVLGPFIVAVALIFAGWITSAILALVFLTRIAHWFFNLNTLGGDWALNVSGLLLVIAGLAASVLAAQIMAVVTTYFTRAALAYCKWNVRFVNGGEHV